MNKLIKISVVFLLSYWIWGVDWSQRYSRFDSDLSRFLVSYEYAPAIRFILVLAIIIFIHFNFKNNIYQYIFTIYSVLIWIINFINDSRGYILLDTESFTIINFAISASVLSLLANRNMKFLEKISFKTTNILLMAGLLFLFLFEFSFTRNATTIIPNLTGLTTINFNRFFGFFGGPIIISTLGGLVIIYAFKNKTSSIFYKFVSIAISFNSIILSNSIAGFFLIFLYYSLSFIFNLFNNFAIKIPRFKAKFLFLFSISLVLIFSIAITQLQSINLILAKVTYIILLITGNISTASELLSTDLYVRSSRSLLARVGDWQDILSFMDITSYTFGSIFSNYRAKYISESGLISFISIYGVPLTLIYFHLLIKNLGGKLTLLLILFNIPYNLFLLHPAYLLFSILLKKEEIESREFVEI